MPWSDVATLMRIRLRPRLLIPVKDSSNELLAFLTVDWNYGTLQSPDSGEGLVAAWSRSMSWSDNSKSKMSMLD